MSPHEILIAIMAAFAVLGALDRIFGNRVGLGPEFENGILSLGSLALSMVGIISLAPVLAGLLRPVVVPVYRVLGADPAMFAGTILANDMGGAPLAKELAGSPEAAKLGGLLVGAMLGATVVFTIPVALGILDPKDRPALAKGVLSGIVTIPVGVLVGGLVAGFPVLMVLRNLIPIVLIALLIALGLWKWEGGMIRGFAVFGRIIVAIITIGLAAALVESHRPGLDSRHGAHFRGTHHCRRHCPGAGRRISSGLGHHQGVSEAPDEAGWSSGHERHRGRRAHCQPGKLHRHVRHGEGHGPAGQGN